MTKAQPGGDNEGRRVPDLFGRYVHDRPRTRTVNEQAVGPIAVLGMCMHVTRSKGRRRIEQGSKVSRTCHLRRIRIASQLRTSRLIATNLTNQPGC